MERSQALLCSFLLIVLVASLEVQADSPCTRLCPLKCAKRGSRAFQCFAFCVKKCNLYGEAQMVKKEQPEAPRGRVGEKRHRKKHITNTRGSKFHKDNLEKTHQRHHHRRPHHPKLKRRISRGPSSG